MPKSRVRKKKVYTPPTDVRPAGGVTPKKPSPQWVPGFALALVVAGMAWLVTFYMTQTAYPIASIGQWNLAIGFGMLVSSLAVFTQWR